MASVLVPSLASISNLLPRRRDTLLDHIERGLQRCVYYEVRATRCQLHDGRLILSGTVSSFYLKQIAQTLVAKLASEWQVDNQIEVAGKDGESNTPTERT